MHTALILCLYFFPHSFPISLWKPIVKTWSFPPQCQCKRAPFAVMAPSFGKCERWVAPNGKHTVSPESVFEGLPRSWVLTNRLKGYCVELRCESSVDWMCDLKKKKKQLIQRKGKKENWWRLMSWRGLSEYLLKGLKDVVMQAFLQLTCSKVGKNES